jgi:DNA ligase (NAD+)
MLSLGNTYSGKKSGTFYDRILKSLNEAPELVCELKFDGTSISLTYEKGILTKALTRGDGQKGDNVTQTSAPSAVFLSNSEEMIGPNWSKYGAKC